MLRSILQDHIKILLYIKKKARDLLLYLFKTSLVTYATKAYKANASATNIKSIMARIKKQNKTERILKIVIGLLRILKKYVRGYPQKLLSKIKGFNISDRRSLTHYHLKKSKLNQLHAVSRTQGRQREPSVKTPRSPLSAKFWWHCVLSGRTQRRALPRHQSEEMEI